MWTDFKTYESCMEAKTKGAYPHGLLISHGNSKVDVCGSIDCDFYFYFFLKGGKSE